MRFDEFNEGLEPGHKAAIKGMHRLSGDQYYGLYKTMNDVAGHDGKKQTAPKGNSDDEVSDKPFAYAYTDEEEAMIKGADPKAKKITSSKSEEVKENDIGAPLTPPTVQQWAAKVKSLYPDVRFIHQKMLNGVTFAISTKAGGKVGFFDPARGINKTVPVGAPVLEVGEENVAPNMAGQIPQSDLRTKRLEVGGVVGYIPRIAGKTTGKVIKAEILEIGGMIGRSAVRVKLLDPQDIADNGGKLTTIISQFDIRQNPYVGESVNEDWAEDALADLIHTRDAHRMGMTPDEYTHYLEKQKQDREYELNIGSEGRSELKRKADELAEIKREKLRQERLHDEEVAFQRAETVQQRKDEMQKISDRYKHELTVIDKEHRNNMEAIRTNNTFELDKLDKEYNDNQRERDFKSSESDKEFRDRNKDREFRAGESDKEFRDRNKDREFRSGESDKEYADRQREREHQQSMAGMEKDQPEEPSPRPRPQRPGPEARPRPEPSKPKPQTWHTSQQVGNDIKDNEDDIEDVEARPYSSYTPQTSKPPALGAPKREAKYDNNRTGFARPQRNDDERHDLDVARPLIYGLKINGKIWKKDGNTVTFFTRERALAARNAILAKRPDVEVGLVQRPKD